MNHAPKLLFVTLMLTMVLSAAFAQRAIELTVDPSNDTVLVLSDGGQTNLGNFLNRKVSWIIKDPAKIQSFQIIPKFGMSDPFTERPGRPHGNRLDETVNLLNRTGDWYYKIVWKDAASMSHLVDPKIAVRPITTPLLEIIIILGLITTAILSVIFFNKWQIAKANLKK
jgi:hypothetical protein